MSKYDNFIFLFLGYLNFFAGPSERSCIETASYHPEGIVQVKGDTSGSNEIIKVGPELFFNKNKDDKRRQKAKTRSQKAKREGRKGFTEEDIPKIIRCFAAFAERDRNDMYKDKSDIEKISYFLDEIDKIILESKFSRCGQRILYDDILKYAADPNRLVEKFIRNAMLDVKIRKLIAMEAIKRKKVIRVALVQNFLNTLEKGDVYGKPDSDDLKFIQEFSDPESIYQSSSDEEFNQEGEIYNGLNSYFSELNNLILEQIKIRDAKEIQIKNTIDKRTEKSELGALRCEANEIIFNEIIGFLPKLDNMAANSSWAYGFSVYDEIIEFCSSGSFSEKEFKIRIKEINKLNSLYKSMLGIAVIKTGRCFNRKLINGFFKSKYYKDYLVRLPFLGQPDKYAYGLSQTSSSSHLRQIPQRSAFSSSSSGQVFYWDIEPKGIISPETAIGIADQQELATYPQQSISFREQLLKQLKVKEQEEEELALKEIERECAVSRENELLKRIWLTERLIQQGFITKEDLTEDNGKLYVTL